MNQKLLFIVSQGFEKSGRATRALQFAAVAAQAGSHVEVFLIDDAVPWAQVGMAEGVHASTGEHLKDLLDQLVSHNGLLHVCKACLVRRQLSPDELLDGCIISTSVDLVERIASPEYKVLTF